jgi:hypothetical protein
MGPGPVGRQGAAAALPRLHLPLPDHRAFLSTRHRAVASGAVLSSSDPDRGFASFRFCSRAVTYGVYKIRMKVTWREGAYQNHEGWVRPTYFRLERG